MMMMVETVSFQVYNDRLLLLIGMSMENHNDVVEMKESHANLPVMNQRIDDENNSVNNRDTALATVPHSLSFYPMFYKMTM